MAQGGLVKDLSIEGGGQIHETLSLRGVLSHLSDVLWHSESATSFPVWLIWESASYLTFSPITSVGCCPSTLSSGMLPVISLDNHWDPKQSIS